jgi:hypothetical protein
MLKNEKGRKPVEIQIPIEKWNETKHAIREGIKKKLDAAKKLIETDKEVSAGLYIYVIEEFGKLLLLDNSKLTNGRGKINYQDEFVQHGVKFGKAFDYLQERDYNNCIVLNDEAGFDPKSFSWRGFTIGLLPKTEARLSIFYVDFVYTNDGTEDIEIMKIPVIDIEILRNGINELENAFNELPV